MTKLEKFMTSTSLLGKEIARLQSELPDEPIFNSRDARFYLTENGRLRVDGAGLFHLNNEELKALYEWLKEWLG